jgi:hypothetical protein
MSQEAVAVEVPDVRRRDAEETSPEYAPIQTAATRLQQVITLSLLVCAEQHSFKPSGGTYYDLLARVALWKFPRWTRYMDVALDQDTKEQEMSVTDVKQENTLALGIEHLHKLEQLGTGRDSTRINSL